MVGVSAHVVSCRPGAHPGEWEVGMAFRDVDTNTRRSLTAFVDERLAEFWNLPGEL